MVTRKTVPQLPAASNRAARSRALNIDGPT